jgi:hypothetical protein
MREILKFRGVLAWKTGGGLAFVANGAMLGFVILHGDFKHIVAADTDAMNFRRLAACVGFPRVIGRGGCVRLAHGRILTRHAGRTKIFQPNCDE